MNKGPLILPENQCKQALVNNVHPSGRMNPEPAACYKPGRHRCRDLRAGLGSRRDRVGDEGSGRF
jgi:hypothetical protein